MFEDKSSYLHRKKNATQIFMIQNFSVEREKMKDFLHHEEKKSFFCILLYTENL